MKKLFTLLFLFSVLTSMRNPAATGLDEVIGAIRSGNGIELARNGGESISLSIPDKTGLYTKAAAAEFLKDFFSANPVKSFDVKFRGEKGGNQFCIGQLQTSNGTYRTTVFMKQTAGRQVVREIRIQKE